MSVQAEDAQSDHYDWPQQGQSLFKPISDPWTACLGWARGQWIGYILGYRRAADAVFALTQTLARPVDSVCFPLLFLWRHLIELQFKFLIGLAAKIDPDVPAYPRTHDLVALWALLRPLLLEFGSSDEDALAVDDLIEELAQIDPGSFDFRYPENKKDEPSLAGAPEYLNLPHAHALLSGLSNYLECAGYALEHRLDVLSDALAGQ